MPMSEILADVRQYPAHHVVVTGGEPMIARDMPELLQALRAAGKHITIETAGTIAPAEVPCDLASLSPKLSSSVPDASQFGNAWTERHERTRLQPDVIRAWCQAYDHQLKFVVSSEADVAEIEVLLTHLQVQTQPENILLMPEGRTTEEIQRRALQVVEWCKVRGWRYCPRLHIGLFGNKRGT